MGGSAGRPSAKGTPSWLSFQPWLRTPLVVEEAITVAIAPAVDPRQRALGGREELAERGAVVRPLHVLGEQDEEERRRVDRSVVGRVRHLAGRSHLAEADLVGDLARLLV